jgi:opacity protein-like surface antigen
MNRTGVVLIFLAGTLCTAQEAPKFTMEALGGISLPMGSAKNEMKFGYDVLIGAGWKFKPSITAMMEFQFDRFSLTPAYLKANSEPAGFNRLVSFSLSPRYYFRPEHKLSEYVTAGAGIYGRELAYTDPSQVQTYCDPYYGEGCQTSSAPIIASTTNYNAGINVGGGILYSPFGTRVKLVTDVRYNRLLSRVSNEFVTVSLGFVY